MRDRLELFLVSSLVLFLELACIRWFPALVDSLVLHSSYSNIRLESYLFTTAQNANIRLEQHWKPSTLRQEGCVLHKTNELCGYHILATDGGIGHVNDFLIDDGGRTVQYLVVDTSNWIGGRSVLISATAIQRIDSAARKIFVNLTRDAIKRGPSVETAQIDPAETVPALWIM